MRIFKYELEVANVQVVSMPEGAEILSVQLQNGIVCVWAMVDPSAQQVKREFRIFGTGHDIHATLLSQMKFVGTVQQSEWVWHVFVMKAAA